MSIPEPIHDRQWLRVVMHTQQPNYVGVHVLSGGRGLRAVGASYKNPHFRYHTTTFHTVGLNFESPALVDIT